MFTFTTTATTEKWFFDGWLKRGTATLMYQSGLFTHIDATTAGTPVVATLATSQTVGTMASDQILKFTAEATTTGAISQSSIDIIYYPAHDA